MVWLLVVDLVPGRRVEKSLTSSGEAGRRDLRVERQSLLVSVLHLLVVSDEYSRRLLLCHRLALYPIKTLAGGGYGVLCGATLCFDVPGIDHDWRSASVCGGASQANVEGVDAVLLNVDVSVSCMS